MTSSLWVPGPLPNLNDFLRASKQGFLRGRGYTVMKQQWGGIVANLARRARLPRFERVLLQFDWREANRRRDPDNLVAGGRKIILDSLVKAEVLPNDGWAHVLGWTDTFAVDGPDTTWYCNGSAIPRGPGVLVTITEVA